MNRTASWASIFAAIALLGGAPALAQQTPLTILAGPGEAASPAAGAPGNRPLPEPLTGPRVPQPAQPPVVPIEVGALKAVDPSVIGLLDDGNGGLGIGMWKGSTRSRVESLLARLPVSTGSPALQGLARRLLLTTAAVPDGAAVAPTMLGIRIERLMASGRVRDVVDLLRLVPSPEADPALIRAKIDASLLSQDYAGACQGVPDALSNDSKPYYMKALAFCRALEKDIGAVSLAVALLRDQGQTGDDAFFQLLAGLTGDAAPVTSLVDPTPLHLAMLRAANQAMPADALSGARPDVLWAIATAPKPDGGVADASLAAAERAEAAGALTTDVLADIYSAANYGAPQIAAALDTSAKSTGAPVNALLFQSAQVAAEPGQRAALLTAAWRAGFDQGQYFTAARVNLDTAKGIDPDAALMGFAPAAIRAFLAAGQPAQAWRWVDMAAQRVRNGGDPAANQVLVTAWPLMQLADPEGALAHDSVRAGRWWSDLPAVANPDEIARRSMLYSLFDAVGDPLPEAAWDPLMAGPLSANGTAPSPAIARALDEASRSNRVGETVALALLSLGDAGTQGAGITAVRDAASALRRIGLGTEARALVVEAALLRGL